MYLTLTHGISLSVYTLHTNVHVEKIEKKAQSDLYIYHKIILDNFHYKLVFLWAMLCRIYDMYFIH